MASPPPASGPTLTLGSVADAARLATPGTPAVVVPAASQLEWAATLQLAGSPSGDLHLHVRSKPAGHHVHIDLASHPRISAHHRGAPPPSCICMRHGGASLGETAPDPRQPGFCGVTRVSACPATASGHGHAHIMCGLSLLPLHSYDGGKTDQDGGRHLHMDDAFSPIHRGSAGLPPSKGFTIPGLRKQHFAGIPAY